MRIISGSFKGKRIIAPGNLPVRPTTDFAKEALFNVLNNYFDFDEISVLDLFAGIGSISLEFASRGAQRIVSVDQDANCIRFINETTQKMKIDDRFAVIRADVFQFLSRNNQGSFDVVFADPFYNLEYEEFLKLIELVKDNNWLKSDGQLVLEHPKAIKFDDHPHLLDSRKYGNVHFSFFNFTEDEE